MGEVDDRRVPRVDDRDPRDGDRQRPGRTRRWRSTSACGSSRSGGNLGYAGGANLGIADWLAGRRRVLRHRVPRRAARTRRARAARRARPSSSPSTASSRPNPGRTWRAGRSWGATRRRVAEVAWASGTCLLLRRACIEDDRRFRRGLRELRGGHRSLLPRPGGGLEGRHRRVACGPGARARSIPGFRTQMYVNQVRLRAKHAGIPRPAKMLAAFPLLAAADAARWLVRRDPVLLRRSGGRVRAVPARDATAVEPDPSSVLTTRPASGRGARPSARSACHAVRGLRIEPERLREQPHGRAAFAEPRVADRPMRIRRNAFARGCRCEPVGVFVEQHVAVLEALALTGARPCPLVHAVQQADARRGRDLADPARPEATTRRRRTLRSVRRSVARVRARCSSRRGAE